MRLLRFDEKRRKFELSKDWEEDEIPQYAILSHTWGADEDEVTFTNIVEGTGEHRSGHRKLLFCAEQARRDDITYFWVDTCCIDKANNVELNTAITSMFRWYQRAVKCYVYLSDVPRTANNASGRNKATWLSDFCDCRWLSRGWTLQELLAPDTVEFYDNTGRKLGDKTSLELEICDTAAIPAEALRGRSLSTFSIEECLSWQKSRRTKKPEDKAYSLSGICGVSMIPIYGEGYDAAMSRLKRLIEDASKGSECQKITIPFGLAGVTEAPCFVGREQELESIHSSLAGDGRRRTVILHGLGGIGKTQTAVAYASRHRKSYSAIFWFNIQDETLLKQSFVKAAQRILQYHPSAYRLRSVNLNGDIDEAFNAVNAWLSEADNTRWLAIYDNYDNPRIRGNKDTAAVDISRFLPDAHQGSIIITTRSSQVRMGQCISMRKLADVDESVAILSSMSRRKLSTEDRNVLALIERLDGLPLALATAGAYLDQVSISIADYLRLYHTSWREIHESDIGLDSYENRTLYSTWRISFDKIEQQNELSGKLLRLWCYFSNRDLWYELLAAGPSEEVPWIQELTSSLHVFSQAMRVLCNYGLVESEELLQDDIDSGGYSIHSCVHMWVVHALNTQLEPTLARYAINATALHIPSWDSSKPWNTQRRLLQHVNRCVEHVKGGTVVETDVGWALNGFGVLYASQTRLAEAEEVYWWALKGHEQALGTHHASTLNVVNNLGILYQDKGKLAEAEQMHLRALGGYGKSLGVERTWSSNAVNSLGLLYQDQGKLAEAEGMFEWVLQDREKALGMDHTVTLDTFNNLGVVYKKQGKLAEAEEMYQRALKGYEEAFGPNAFTVPVLNAMNNLGSLYIYQGKLTEAEEVYVRVLNGYETTRGPDELSRPILNITYNFAILYEDQGKLEKAEEMFKRTLKGYDLVFGSDHANTTRIADRLCDLYRDMAFQQRFIHQPSVSHDGRHWTEGRRTTSLRILRECISICRQYPSSSSTVYGDIGHMLMWNSKDGDAASAFEQEILREHTITCDGCDNRVSLKTGRLICKSCLDVDLCLECFKKYELDAIKVECCQDHAFLQSPREAGSSHLNGTMPMTGDTLTAWLDGLIT